MTEVLVCKDGEMADGGVRLVKAGAVEIGVIRHKGQYYAYRNVCPHQGGPVCEGVRVLAVLLSPFLPAKAPLMLAAVGESGDDVAFERAVLGDGSGRSVDASGGPLFPRVDTPPA